MHYEGTWWKIFCEFSQKNSNTKTRQLAPKQYYSNERSLKKKGTWEQFQSVVREYADLDLTELVPRDELQRPTRTVYYLPMHGVVKDSSTTTNLRVVFDASVKTGFALNDLLIPGPSFILLSLQC